MCHLCLDFDKKRKNFSKKGLTIGFQRDITTVIMRINTERGLTIVPNYAINDGNGQRRLTMNVRLAQKADLVQLLELYKQLHDNYSMPFFNEALEKLWEDILEDKNHNIIVGLIGGQIVSSCVILIVPNLTHNQCPYALIENVITHELYRNKGYATELLNFAKEIAQDQNCYKIMLMTGSKQEETLKFYEKAGYNRNDKTAFIQWLD
jgi:GNAT superfamily N-acetyltransferase